MRDVESLEPPKRATLQLPNGDASPRNYPVLSSINSIHIRDLLDERVQPLMPNVRTASILAGRRVRQHGHPSLPLPPLLDRQVIEAKERHTAPKPAAEKKDLTDFQKELAANPYAQALATPVRQCHFTQARLPSHFLQSLTTSFDASSPSSEKGKGQALRIVPSPSASSPRTSPTGSATYVNARRDALQHLGVKARWTGIVTDRMREACAKNTGKNMSSRDTKKAFSWDDSIGDKVLKELRERVLDSLQACLRNKGSGSKGQRNVISLQDLQATPDTILLRSTEPKGVEKSGDSEPASQTAPVYDLSKLLSSDQLSALPALHSGEAAVTASVVVLSQVKTLGLRMALNRLAAYIDAKQPQYWVLLRGEWFVKMQESGATDGFALSGGRGAEGE